jgi:hypothetical protein
VSRGRRAISAAAVVTALTVIALSRLGATSGTAPPGRTGNASDRSGASPADGSGAPAASANAGRIPSLAHIFVIVMENEELGSIIGNGSAPYVNGLADQYGLATNDTAVAHPSEPNYLALWSGSTQGVRSDGLYTFTAGETLADEVEVSGRTWNVAAENVPLGCYTGATASGGEDGPGTYARKHEPAISWLSVASSPARCAHITDFSHFDPTVGNLWFIVPNLCNDMHDCSIATGDSFLRGFVARILATSAMANGVIFLTWDEGSTSLGGGGKIPTLVIGPSVKPGFKSATSHRHDSLLRTIEEAWAMPCLGAACTANDLGEFFK